MRKRGQPILRAHTRLAALVVALSVVAVLVARPSDAAEDFVLGNGQGTAQSLRLAAIAGGTSLGATSGRSVAKYQQRGAWGEATVLDLGILGDLLTAEACREGATPTYDADTVIPSLRLDNREPGNAELQSVEVTAPGKSHPGKVIGVQRASAAEGPFGQAMTEVDNLDGGALLRAVGPTTHVVTRVVGRTRETIATSSFQSLSFFGLVTFMDPEWRAVHRSGDETTAEGTFTFSSVNVLGTKKSLEEGEEQAKEILRALTNGARSIGMQFSYPEVKVTGDTVEVTPLALYWLDNPAAKVSFGDVLAKATPLKEAIATAMIQFDCSMATTWTILDILLSIMAGTGGITLEYGGVTALTNDQFFESPFGAATFASSFGSSTGGGAAGFSPTRSGTASSSPLRSTPATAAPVSAEVGPVEDQAIAAPAALPTARDIPGSKGGAAIALGAGGLLGVLALAALDLLAMRRGRRRIPEATP